MPHRILLVTYHYPPDVSVGTHRWPPIVRHLRRQGHELTVLTTSAFGVLPDDAPWVVRTRDLQASPVLRRVLRRPAVIAAAGRPEVVVPPAPRFLSHGLVPDAHLLSWNPFAVPVLRRLVRERSIECVVTNSPLDSTHLVGLALPRPRPAWVADFEDGWRFERLSGEWPTRAQDRLDAALEARVVRSADVVVAATAPIAEDFRDRLGGVARTAPIGWDPELEAGVPEAAPPSEPGTVSVVHTGILSHAERRDPTGLLAALERIAATDSELAGRLRVVLAGRRTAGDEQLLASLSAPAAALVRHVGELDRPAAIALQRSADALLLLSTGPHRSVATGKVYEYLAAGKPILALADENEASRIVRETGTGVVVAPQDPQAIHAAMRALASGDLARSYAPRGLEAYIQPGPARAMEAVIEHAIAARRG